MQTPGPRGANSQVCVCGGGVVRGGGASGCQQKHLSGGPSLTGDSDAGVDGGAPAGTDDHHVVGLGQLALYQQPEHLREALSQRVGALDDVHAVVAGAGSQAGQPGQLRGGHRCHGA